MYRPNFCSECGSKLLRLRWHFWTSRRFCNSCARRLRRARLLPWLLSSLSLIVVGYVAGRARRPSPPPLIIERRSDSPLADNQPATLASSAPPAERSTSPSQATPDEPVYICGARTKKGTPCSRRVHGPVRCWQHMVVSSQVASVQPFMTDAKSNVCLWCAY